MVVPLPILSERKAVFNLTGRMVPAGIGSADRVLRLGGLIDRLQILSSSGLQVHREHAQRQTKHPQIVSHFVPPKGVAKRALWFFRTLIPSVTPVRSLRLVVQNRRRSVLFRRIFLWTMGIKRSSARLPLCACRREPAIGVVRAISHASLRAAL